MTGEVPAWGAPSPAPLPRAADRSEAGGLGGVVGHVPRLSGAASVCGVCGMAAVGVRKCRSVAGIALLECTTTVFEITWPFKQLTL